MKLGRVRYQTMERSDFAISGHDPTTQIATALKHLKLAGEFDFTVLFLFFFCPYFSFAESPFPSFAQKSFPM